MSEDTFNNEEYDDELEEFSSDEFEYIESEQEVSQKNDDDDENYDEVLTLTQFDGNLNANNNLSIVAEYENIDIVKTNKTHQVFAKSFVSKITKLVLEFNDTELSDSHKKYIQQVGQLQLENLADLLSLVDINKQLLNNIILRINSVQAEDYAMIATYNAAVTQHIKLIKELQNTYKNIPNVIKRMRTEVLCNQELLPGTQNNGDEIITENYGETQFNNQKALLKKLREGYGKSTNDE